MTGAPRKIIHVDMDAFYASVEQRDRPELRGRPVVVGGRPGMRGVVAACSYEARAFGVHSAMPTSRAERLCPDAVFVRPRMDRYVSVSREVRQIFREVTDRVEPLSLDEAYLDVSENKLNEPLAGKLARHLKDEIKRRTGLTASAGAGPSKLVAKIASDVNKPDGFLVVPPDDVAAFLAPLPVSRSVGSRPQDGRSSGRAQHQDGRGRSARGPQHAHSTARQIRSLSAGDGLGRRRPSGRDRARSQESRQ